MKKRIKRKIKAYTLLFSGFAGAIGFVGFTEAWMLPQAFACLAWVVLLCYANRMKKPSCGNKKAKKIEKVTFTHYFDPNYKPNFKVTQLK